MRLQAPERESGLGLDPMRDDWSSAEHSLSTPEGRRRLRRRRRLPRVAGMVAGSLAALLLVLAVSGPVRRLIGGHGRSAVVPPASNLALGVQLGARTLAAVIAVPAGRPSTVVAIPPDTRVDIPDGGPTLMSQAGTGGGIFDAAVEATMDVRVPHYVLIGEADLQALVDRLGGVQVDVELAFSSNGQALGPGPVKLLGADVATYLRQATDTADLTARWEDVLTGMFTASGRPGLWTFPLGQSDDLVLAAKLLAQARGAAVTELPADPGSGGLDPDRKAIASLVAQSFAETTPPLIRVVVLEGRGRFGYGASIASVLAPIGFRVVSAQSQASKSMLETQVIASDPSFLAQANQVVAVLGRGKVYVGSQPTGIADITIVVGKDLSAG